MIVLEFEDRFARQGAPPHLCCSKGVLGTGYIVPVAESNLKYPLGHSRLSPVKKRKTGTQTSLYQR